MKSRARRVAARLFAVWGTVWYAGCASAPAEEPGPPPTASGTELAPAGFTAEQARRGQGVFTSVCSTCHGRNEFTGPIFALTWMEEPVANLYDFASANMPQDAPGSLPPEDYAAVVAYLLQLNGRAPGDEELPADRERLTTLRW